MLKEERDLLRRRHRLPLDFWNLQPRCTLKTGWVTYNVAATLRKRVELQVLIYSLAIISTKELSTIYQTQSTSVADHFGTECWIHSHELLLILSVLGCCNRYNKNIKNDVQERVQNCKLQKVRIRPHGYCVEGCRCASFAPADPKATQYNRISTQR